MKQPRFTTPDDQEHLAAMFSQYSTDELQRIQKAINDIMSRRTEFSCVQADAPVRNRESVF